MNVASLENCKELYELSGYSWHSGFEHPNDTQNKYKVPAYDSGFLLRKLPEEIKDDEYGVLFLSVGACGAGEFEAEYNCGGDCKYTMVADTPEDALCLLAISLYKQGILQSTEEKK